MPVEILHRSGELVLGAVGNVHLSVYRATPTAALLEIDQRFHEALAKKTKTTVVLTMTPFGIALPDADARALATQLVRQNSRFVKASAAVTPGDGFWASAARSAITAVFVLARQPYPSKVFADALEAGTWLAPHATVSAMTMRDALAELEKR